MHSLPNKVSIIHCPGHQKGDSPIVRGNNMADRAARTIASQRSTPILVTGVTEKLKNDWTKGWPDLQYSTEEENLISQYPTNYKTKQGYWKTQKGETILPKDAALDLMHRWTHLGEKKLVEAVKGSQVFVQD